MNGIAGKIELLASTSPEILPGFAPFERAFILAVKRFREKEAATKTGQDSATVSTYDNSPTTF